MTTKPLDYGIRDEEFFDDEDIKVMIKLLPSKAEAYELGKHIIKKSNSKKPTDADGNYGQLWLIVRNMWSVWRLPEMVTHATKVREKNPPLWKRWTKYFCSIANEYLNAAKDVDKDAHINLNTARKLSRVELREANPKLINVLRKSDL